MTDDEHEAPKPSIRAVPALKAAPPHGAEPKPDETPRAQRQEPVTQAGAAVTCSGSPVTPWTARKTPNSCPRRRILDINQSTSELPAGCLQFLLSRRITCYEGPPAKRPRGLALNTATGWPDRDIQPGTRIACDLAWLAADSDRCALSASATLS